jgi:peptidoglycan/xylan/chitin deacetylase (PgdA/CDA1 family)
MSHNNSSPWFGDCKGAVSLTFDDASQSQLDIAIPILNEYGLHGTFYINPGGDDWKQRLVPWQEVAKAGHEIGNHTISHICSGNFGWGAAKTLETITLDEMEADILEAEKRIKELVPEQTIRSFCYPCYQNYVGEGATRQSYVPVVAQYFPAARGMGEAPNHPAFTDLHYLTSVTIAGWMPGSELCILSEESVKQGRWVILVFHGFQKEPRTPRVAGSYWHGSPVSAEDFRELCKYLDANRDRIWTAPTVKIAQSIIEWRKGN